jgi:hypothetical protein
MVNRPAETDDRFKHIASDPRYRRTTKKAPLAKVDKRFQAVFKDKDFATNVAVDKFGRKIEVKNTGLNKLYDDEDDDEEEEKPVQKKSAASKKAAAAKPVVVEEEEEEEEDAEDSTDIGSTDDEMNDEPDSDEGELDDGYIAGSIANTAAPVAEKPTRRIAMMNMEWEQLRAVDMLAVMRSFCPAEGAVHSVSIYPSEFGKQRMAQESSFGPVDLFRALESKEETRFPVEEEGMEGLEGLEWVEEDDEDHEMDEDEELELADAEEDAEDDAEDDIAAAMKASAAQEGAEVDQDAESEVDASDIELDDMIEENDGSEGIDMNKLREYELTKLRYFYAIVECDSAETALKIYKEADGLEYESTSNVFDLRFVPDEQVFDEATLRDRATVVPANHQPPNYQTAALQQTNVKCTWDREDPLRAKILRQNFEPGTYKADDVSVFLASESDEEGYGTDVPVSESEDSSDDEQDDGRVIRKENGKKTVLLKRRLRTSFSDILSEIYGGANKEAKKQKEMQKRVDKANRALKGEEDEEESESEEEESSDSDDQEIVFQPALQSFADRVVNKAKEKEEDAVKSRMSVWQQHLEKIKEKKKARKADAKVRAKQEAISAGKVQKGSLYDDDEVEVDQEDDFFKDAFNEEEFGPQGGKGKKAHADSDSDDEEDAKVSLEEKKRENARRKAELELMMMKDQREVEEEQRGYSLRDLVKDNKLKHKAEARKRKTRADNENELIDSVMGQKVESKVTADDIAQVTKRRQGGKKKTVEDSVTADNFKVNISDSRFTSALHSDPAFAIDPTSQHYKATAGTEALLQEAQRQRRENVRSQEKQIKARKQTMRQGVAGKESASDEKSELQSLVSKIKAVNAVDKMQKKKK